MTDITPQDPTVPAVIPVSEAPDPSTILPPPPPSTTDLGAPNPSEAPPVIPVPDGAPADAEPAPDTGPATPPPDLAVADPPVEVVVEAVVIDGDETPTQQF